MARIITFSRDFPKGHTRAGHPTHFPEQLFNAWGIKYWSKLKYLDLDNLNPDFDEDLVAEFHRELDDYQSGRKFHTIRAGKRWKAGDMFSPRVWSGKPYQSKMIKLAQDVRIEKVWDVRIVGNRVFIDNNLFCDIGLRSSIDYERFSLLAKNDGLSVKDLIEWFKMPCDFDGQIICWDKTIQYGADRISEVS